MFNALKLWLLKYRVYVVILGAISCFGFGWYVKGVFYEAGEKRDLQKSIDDHREQEEKNGLKAARLEKELADLRNSDKRTDEEVKNEITKPNYSCKLPESGRLLINKAITGASSTR